MDCPYCGKGLIPGFIYGGSYGVNHSLRWLPETKKPTLAELELEGEVLNKNRFFSQPEVKCYKCAYCRKIIIDLDE
ncbi:PF20097 family protein [Lutispora saccharofermentans]|uniref:PF20097 family protein n=1 Tax=Lutispora saccharofermentans TaxID=3024236 RepID=A0ABT1NKK6_9FIRM|nr:PF20097 family protein [Lutispora saccharofermentans]MCQ1531794.1 PF20097 family protein [Lutispora saccharofermentans]